MEPTVSQTNLGQSHNQREGIWIQSSQGTQEDLGKGVFGSCSSFSLIKFYVHEESTQGKELRVSCVVEWGMIKQVDEIWYYHKASVDLEIAVPFFPRAGRI